MVGTEMKVIQKGNDRKQLGDCVGPRNDTRKCGWIVCWVGSVLALDHEGEIGSW